MDTTTATINVLNITLVNAGTLLALAFANVLTLHTTP